VDGEVISTTGEHPFWVPDIAWVEAKDLQVGSLLHTDKETFVDIDRIERREGSFKVYNFGVEGIPTYFVSDLGILVHNACVDTRINIPNGRTKTTPLRPSTGERVSAGFKEHVIPQHFNRPPAN
jgi:intein/homing endonuclease